MATSPLNDHHHRSLHLFETWLIHNRYTRNTIKGYRSVLRRFFEHHHEHHPHHLTHEHVEVFVKHFLEKGLRTETVTSMTCVLHLYLEQRDLGLA